MPPLHEWLVGFGDWEGHPRQGSTRCLASCCTSAMPGPGAPPNVVLVHYDDLLADLDGSMRRIAGLLGIPVDEERWPALVHAATFDAMRAGARAPDTLGVLKEPAAFFRQGGSGDGRALLTGGEVAHYRARVAGMAPPDLLDWLHRDAGCRDRADRARRQGLDLGARRPCPECGFDASSLPAESVAPLLRANADAWGGVLRRPETGLRRAPPPIAGRRSSTPATSATSACSTSSDSG